MGWTGYTAHYYKNGKVDRKAECDAYFMDGLNEGHFEVVKSSMVGSTYYSAVRNLKKCVGTDGNGWGIYEDLPESEQEVRGFVFLTQVKDGEFYYKDMTEDMLPYYFDCPKSIIKALSPTDNENANIWRNKCLEKKAKKNDYPIGTVLTFEWWNGEKKIIKRAPNRQFKTAWWEVVGERKYFSKKNIPWDSVTVMEG
jgi:hypothetical protein